MRTILTLAVVILSVVGMTRCTTMQKAGTSPVELVIVSLEGGPGDDEAAYRHTFESDVMTRGRVLEDGGRVLLALAPKDPGTADLPTRPSPANFVTVNRYRVRFLRTDGRASPGVDVPYGFDGGMTFTVGAEGGVGRFVLVRGQSKMEPPLVSLRSSGGSVALSTLAEVTFFGRDQAGHDVSATGLVGVNFADWPDEAL
jgi:hypothetical protein